MCCIVATIYGYPADVYGPFDTHAAAIEYRNSLSREYTSVSYYIRDMTNPD